MRGSFVGVAIVAVTTACGTASSPPDAARDLDASQVPITLWGEVAVYETRDPFPGIEVCVRDVDPAVCDETDATGLFELRGVPRDAEIELSIAEDRDDLLPFVVPVRTRAISDYLGVWGVLRRETFDAFRATYGVEWDPSTGIVVAEVLRARDTRPFGDAFGGFEGVSASSDEGTEPLYGGEAGTVIDRDRTSTSSTGLVFFFGVAPGEHELSFVHAGARCVPDAATWPGSSATSLRFRARADRVVDAGRIFCIRTE